MRIVHVYNWLDPAIGGPPRVIVGLVAGQQQAGHDVHLVSSDLPGAAPVEALLAAHLDPIPPRTTVRPKFFRPVINRGRLRRALEGADVAHLHGIWPPVTLLASQMCRQMGIPYVLAPHGSLHAAALRERPVRKIAGIWALGYGAMIQHADALHALNDEEAEGVVWVNLPDRIAVIPNGVFPEQFTSRPPAGLFRGMLPALGDAPYILFLSRLHPGKGLDLLGEAFGRVARRHPEVHLVVAGDDHGARADLESRLRRHGVRERAHLVGHISGARKDAAFCEASLFCLPSRHEGFSMAITEALAWGRPAVITHTCHFQEVASEDCGLITRLDVDDLAEAMSVLLGDPPRADAMGRRGRKMVMRRFTWPALAERTLDLYREIIRR